MEQMSGQIVSSIGPIHFLEFFAGDTPSGYSAELFS